MAVGLTFWDTFWATFAGGLAAALISIVGIIIVERVRADQELAREKRAADERRVERLRASRNAAKAVVMELHAAARPLRHVLGGHGAWEPMHVVRLAWDSRENRVALIDRLTDDALFNVEHAYHELAAIEQRLEEDPGFLQQLLRDDGKFGKRLLAVHVDPALDDLHLAVAAIETLQLAVQGQLQAEADRMKQEEENTPPS